MSIHQRRAELFVMMQLRLLGLGRNPLRRRVDRLEAALIMLALVGALLAVPAAAALGTTIRHSVGDGTPLGLAAGLALPLLVWPLLFLLFRFARRPLDARRALAWAREWEQVAARWTRPQH